MFQKRRSYPAFGAGTQNSSLCFIMVYLMSQISSGFAMRYAFTKLFFQLLAVSNYLDISHRRPNMIAEALKIENIEFPSHVMIGTQVRLKLSY